MKKLALIGRPNVGKSFLFNRICKKKIAIVDPQEGVTRDKLYGLAAAGGSVIQVIDTGGLKESSKSLLYKEIYRQTKSAIEEADILALVVDGKMGPTHLDRNIALLLFRAKKPLFLVINKVDSSQDVRYLFFSLGIRNVVQVSALQNLNIDKMLSFVSSSIKQKGEKKEKDLFKVAIIGRENVGKSTLFNSFLKKERAIVNHRAGTTKDYVECNYEDKYLLIDTAGLKQRKKEKTTVDKFARVRTEEAIKRADVCLLILDATEGITSFDKRLAHLVEKEGKGCIFLFNKWDLLSETEGCFLKKQREQAPFFTHLPFLCISAKNRKNLKSAFLLVQKIHEEYRRKITTPKLNRFVKDTVQRFQPPLVRGKRLNIYYAVQTKIAPPSFSLFVNKSSLLSNSYKKYLLNQFRISFGFKGVPLFFHVKGK